MHGPIIADVYLSLNGKIIPNHGYVVISDIGSENNAALLCHTDRPPPSDDDNSGGNWFASDSDETRVDGNDVPGFSRNRGPMVVRLKRTSGSPMVGIYKCAIKHSKSDYSQKVHVGLYNNTNKGRIKLCAEVVKFSYVSNCFP